MKKKCVSIVIPCYNEQETLPTIYPAITDVMKTIPEYDYEILLVDDGSKDRTNEMMKELAAKDEHVRYFSFSRNFGKEAAIYAGLCNAKGDFVTTMDADMQDPPALLPEMVRVLEEEDFDSVATRRVSRKGEPVIRSFFSRSFYKVIRKISDVDIADGARDYRMMTREMTDSVIALSENNRFSKGIFAWVGYKTKWLEFENVERVAGETKWSFWKLLKYSMDGITNFSNVPLMISSYMGMLLTFFSFLAIIFIIVRKLIFDDPVSGWPSLVCIITLIGGIQLFCMGIMGQYLSKTYMEVKRRPHYIIRETNSEDAERNK
ncbi:MAG: glycosyltransferase family 2 protein [Roseburia sp.]|uniref:glycosyltransferase family 2 protein n=1 Tax=Roseburia sp. 831b TaxID=1261635 RepID=UPI0009516430|nr:glycosyltransferase family 2 protein [Roseburia sp. 831b]MCI5918066.1 glycosyltransferase family 2 protein [Roseburia sp.]MDD6217043.1 glycosyltransferase family 2 protein [Roseburia sp.]WVK73498.1 glycosyltransferase family 2 protein [Roseburia sp. 831b]